MMSSKATAYRFADFTLDTQEWRLFRQDQPIEVQQKVLDLLAALVERPGGLWTREELHARLWPDVFVGEAALFQLVRKARQALDDDAREPRFIATVPNRGYRFVAPLSSSAAEAALAPAPEAVEGAGERRERTHHLPSERDAFVGRVSELADLRSRLLSRAALVTVTGEGGIGKTRLAVHLGWSVLGDFAGGVWFGDLTEARDVEGVLSAVARVLDVPLSRKGRDQLGHVLNSLGSALLILDNAEQVIGAAREVVGGWLAQAPLLRVLVTSRSVLALPSEQVVALPPLPPPDAAALFVARAQAARPDPALASAQHPAAVDALVTLLDGLPLALELAAARTRAWSPELLLARMQDRFRLLARVGQDGRQATLWSTIAWGWELLEPWAQSALVGLAVFEGGFTLEAAEAVLALPADAPWPMDAVQSLVERSWLRPRDGDRFGMLLSIQEFCLASASAEQRAAAELRHGQWAATVPSSATQELDNVLAACARATARGDAAVTASCLQMAWVVLEVRGPLQVALDRVDAALARFVSPTPPTVLEVAASVYHQAGRLEEAMALAERGLAQSPSRSARMVLLYRKGSIADDLGEGALTQACLEEALALARETGHRANEAVILGDMGISHARRAELSVAQGYFEAALALHHTLGNRQAAGRVLSNLGLIETYQGRLENAEARYQESLAAHREVGNRRAAGIVHNNRALLLGKQGRVAEARESYLEALRDLRAVGARVPEGNALVGLGSLLLLHSGPEAAQPHLEAALHIHRSAGNRASVGVALGRLAQLHHLRRDLAQARALYREALVDLASVGDPGGSALVEARLGLLLAEQGEPDASQVHLQDAQQHAQIAGDPELILLVQALQAEAAAVRGDPHLAQTLLAPLEARLPPPPEGAEHALAILAARQRITALSPPR